MSDDNNTTETTTVATPNPTPAPAPPAQAQGKVWTDEYVQGLREEAKDNRIKAKGYESKLRKAIGLSDDEELNDDKITAYQDKLKRDYEAAISKADDRLIQAEIKSLEGYDTKLVAKLLDKSDVKIADDGTVTGITEALAKLEAEFPQVKTVAPAQPGANPPPQGNKTLKDEYDEVKAQIAKNPGNSALMQKLFLIKEKMK